MNLQTLQPGEMVQLMQGRPMQLAIVVINLLLVVWIAWMLASMTLEEKVSQTLYTAPAIERLGIPEYNWWNEALHGVARAGRASQQNVDIPVIVVVSPGQGSTADADDWCKGVLEAPRVVAIEPGHATPLVLTPG